MFARFSNPFYFMDWAYNLSSLSVQDKEQYTGLECLIRRIVEERNVFRALGEPQTPCLLNRLIDVMEKTNEMDLDEVVSETITSIFGGKDSTATATMCNLFTMASNPVHQQKCIDELNSIFADDPSRPVTKADTNQMNYLEKCILETHRIYPIIPFVSRELGQDEVFSGVKLPKGSTIFIAPFATHRIEHIYADSEKFEPDRHGSEDAHLKNPYAFIPFTKGSRICIGMKMSMFIMKVLLSTILREYTLETVAGKEDLDIRYRVNIKIFGGVWINLKKRNQV